MTVGPWIDRAWVGLLPDTSKFVPEANRAITRALNDIERRVTTESGRITRRFDDLARGANRALDGIGRDAFDGLRTDADRAARGVNTALDGIGRHAFDGLKTDADRAARGVEDAFDGVGGRAFDGLKADANRAAEDIEAEFRGAERESDRALRGIGGPGQFRDVERQADRAADRIGHDFLRARTSASFSLGGLTTRATVAGGLIGAALGTVGVAAVKMGLDSAAAMEQAQISFGQLLGSGRRAKDFLAELNRFGAATPFELPGLIATSRQLLGAGQAAKDIIPILTAVGDATGALGLDQQAFERIMLAVTQAMNKGRLQGEELMQMQEAGLPVTAMLAKALGVTTKRVGELSQAGKLQSDEVLPKLFDQMHKDYGGSMIKQSRTLNGLWSTFVDTTRNALREGIQPLLPAIKDALPEAARILEGAIRSVVGFFRDDLGPELGRIKQAWDDNGAAILGLFTNMARGRGEMDSSATAAHSLADALVVLTNALGDAARLGGQVSTFLNNLNTDSQNLGDSINDRLQPVWDHFIHRTALGEGTLRLFNLMVNDVKADLGDLGVTLGQTSHDTNRATSAAEDHTTALRNEKAATDALKDSLQDERNAEINVRQAKLNVSLAQERLNTLRRQGKQGTNEYKQAQITLDRAQINLITTTQEYNGKVSASRDAERRAASASEALRSSQNRLRDSTYTAGRQLLIFGDRAQDAFAKLKNKSIHVQANYNTSAPRGIELLIEKGLVRQRHGGPLRGPGTTTSDDIPAMLSNEEHVVEADAVRGLGGGSHAAGHQELKALRRQWRGFADGGGVTARYTNPGQGAWLRRPPRFDWLMDQALAASARGFGELIRQFRDQIFAPAFAGGPVWKWLWAQVHSQFPNAQLISAYRPGARTHATGAVSYHATGRAIDVTPSMAIFNWIARMWGPKTAELIFSPAGARQIHNGVRHMYTGVTRADHWNHIHWAMRSVPGAGQGTAAGGTRAGLSAAEAWIIQRESGGRTTADNPTSTAFGLGQLLLANRRKYGAMFHYDPNTTDYNQQLTMMRAYIRERYGTAERAKAFWQAHGWYRAGGPVRPTIADRGLTLRPGLNAVVADNRTGRPERLVPATQQATVVNIQAGAVQIGPIYGPVTPGQVAQMRASVEDGLHTVLREFRTGTAA